MRFHKMILFCTLLSLGLSPALAKTGSSGSPASPTAVTKTTMPGFREVQILNETADRYSRMYLLDNVQVPIAAPAPVGQTLKEDLERYLKTRVALDPAASRQLTVTLQKAEAYWVLPLDQKVTLDGFDLQDRRPDDREFVLEGKVFFEVREAGRVERSWLFDRKVSLPDGRAEFPGEIQGSYGRLLERFRKIFFEALDREFWAGLR